VTVENKIATVRARDCGWLASLTDAVRISGCAVLEGAIHESLLISARAAMYRVRDAIVAELGLERLRQAGEIGVLRIPMKYDPVFFQFLELPEVLSIVDSVLSPTAILHTQNGFLLPSFSPSATPTVFQNSFHQDFPRVLNGFVASVNVMVAIDAFTEENGATLVAPGTHQQLAAPDLEYIRSIAIPVEAEAGSLLVFDSTLWHAAGTNLSGTDRVAINQQFTRSYFKQQIDYVRALGDSAVQARSPRTQQLLGWYTRVVTSLEEYYQPPERRRYRKGQD
jgi:ectoine hydroxylase-related dioxygenase (phytanoyl-CoA dioxygenase family)